MNTQPGMIVVLSAPSGAGKRTLLERLFAADPRACTTVSATTRAPRPDEQHGIDYYFVSPEEFAAQRAAEAFVEWAQVHNHLYGTLRSELERCTRDGRDVVLELDVQGMRSLRALEPGIVSIFLMPPSLEELERRLRARGTNDDTDIALRLSNAAAEMAARHEFDYIIVNDNVDEAAANLGAILRAERCRAHRHTNTENPLKQGVEHADTV